MRFFLFFIPLLLFSQAHIFVLHRIGDARHPSTNTSVKELEKYLKYVKTHGYRAVKLSALVKMKNDKNLDNVVVFTIDDSYKSFYENGLAVFKKYNIPFTLFVYGKATTQKWGDFMSWDEVRECAKYGELGVHSWAHPHLAKISNEKIAEDTKKAIGVFKKEMGYVPDMYAYPYGEYDERVKKVIKKFFNIIANQNPGAYGKNSPDDDINRFALTGDVDIGKKLKTGILNIKNLQIKRNKNTITLIEGFTDKPYVDVYITGFGWKRVKVKNGCFRLSPDFVLKKYRNRVIISYNYEMISKLILKEE